MTPRALTCLPSHKMPIGWCRADAVPFVWVLAWNRVPISKISLVGVGAPLTAHWQGYSTGEEVSPDQMPAIPLPSLRCTLAEALEFDASAHVVSLVAGKPHSLIEDAYVPHVAWCYAPCDRLPSCGRRTNSRVGRGGGGRSRPTPGSQARPS